jgi:hypothetical protein
LRATTAQTAARLALALEPRYDRDREAAIAWSAERIRADLA